MKNCADCVEVEKLRKLEEATPASLFWILLVSFLAYLLAWVVFFRSDSPAGHPIIAICLTVGAVGLISFFVNMVRLGRKHKIQLYLFELDGQLHLHDRKHIVQNNVKTTEWYTLNRTKITKTIYEIYFQGGEWICRRIANTLDWRLMGATCVVRSPGRLISSLADPLRGGEFCFRSGHSGLQICGLSFRQMQYLGKRLEFLERSLGTFSQVNELYALQELWQKLMAQMSRDLAETKSATRSPIGEYVQDYLEELRLGILSTQSYRGWGKTKAQLGAEDKENIEHFLVYDLAKILPRLPVYEKAYVAKKKERGRPLTKPDLEEAGKEAEKETPKETKEEKEQE